MTFVDRENELTKLKEFWESTRAHCIPVVGRRRVGKTALLEKFAEGKNMVYYRCSLAHTDEQLPLLGAALASHGNDAVLTAQPPSSWDAIFALIERYAKEERFLLILDELPYWVIKHDQVPSILQNWWDARGRYLNLMLVLCGSALQMMENLLTGDAPLAGCVTGRLSVRPFTYREASWMLSFPDPVDTIAAFGILGGVPLYLSFFEPSMSIRDNIARHIVSPSSRLYVEPNAVFSAHHKSFDRADALRALGAIARGAHQWSKIHEHSKVPLTTLHRLLDVLMGDMHLVRKLLPVTEDAVDRERSVRVLYRLTDNFFRFWFAFVEPHAGRIEFGNEAAVADTVMNRLSDFMGEPFERVCQDWTRRIGPTGRFGVEVARVGEWWTAHDQIDVVGLESSGKVSLTGECKWQEGGFSYDDLRKYLGHVSALDREVLPEAHHVLFSKTTFAPEVQSWAAAGRVTLLTPANLLSD